MIWSGSLKPSGITSVFPTTVPVPLLSEVCFDDVCLCTLLALTCATESIFSCLVFKSSGRFGNGDDVLSRGSTTSLRRVFFLSGSDERGGVGDFDFPAEDVWGRLLCFSWYLARFGFKTRRKRHSFHSVIHVPTMITLFFIFTSNCEVLQNVLSLGDTSIKYFLETVVVLSVYDEFWDIYCDHNLFTYLTK